MIAIKNIGKNVMGRAMVGGVQGGGSPSFIKRNRGQWMDINKGVRGDDHKKKKVNAGHIEGWVIKLN